MTAATLRYGQEVISYSVERRSTRKTLGIEVHPDGRVVVRAPAKCAEEVIRERVHRRASWILRQLAEFSRYQPRRPQRQYVGGESHLFLGRQYRLKIVSGRETGVRLGRGDITVTVHAVPTSRRVKAQLDTWYRARAREVFSRIVEETLGRVGKVPPPRLIIRTMQSRWGSLSAAGTMTLNIRLVQAPRACIEYVIAHELCHAMHRDHDKRFLRLLERVLPDWERRKRRLETALL